VGTVRALDAAALTAALTAALSDDETRRRDRAARAELMRSLAARNVERACEVLG
jgi:hypothetical protein